MSSDFSRRLVLLRKEKGISQKAAAGELQISQALLSHYEKGIRECGLDFIIRCADFYGVSCDYLLGRSPVPSGQTLSIEDLPECDTKGDGASGLGVVPALSKKLIFNSLNIVFDLLSKTKNKTLITEASSYLMLSVYKVFRRLYSANPKNQKELFKIPAPLEGHITTAAMQANLAKMDGALSGEKIKGITPLKAEDAPGITTDRLREEYPLYTTSLLNLVQNAEDSIKKNL